MTDPIARNDTSDAAGRWLLPIISPQEAWKANDSSGGHRREVPNEQADSPLPAICRCLRVRIANKETRLPC